MEQAGRMRQKGQQRRYPYCRQADRQATQAAVSAESDVPVANQKEPVQEAHCQSLPASTLVLRQQPFGLCHLHPATQRHGRKAAAAVQTTTPANAQAAPGVAAYSQLPPGSQPGSPLGLVMASKGGLSHSQRWYIGHSTPPCSWVTDHTQHLKLGRPEPQAQRSS